MKLKVTVAALGLLTALTGPASAADLGGNCCADLEERIAELEATTARKGNRKVKLEISGQINEALMLWDDSRESNVYQGTNDTARTRIRFKGEATISDDVKAGYLLEFGVRTNRLNRTDQDNPNSNTNALDVRHSVWYLESKTLGRGSVGLTAQSTDGATEVTTANTNHFLRPALSKFNGDFFLVNEGVQTNRRWRDFMTQSGFTGDNVAGEGDRRNLVRYDSPEFQGFKASASWGEDDFWDVALRYKGELGDFKLAAAIGYAEYSDFRADQDGDSTIPADGQDESVSLRGCARGFAPNSDNDCDELGLSASIMHSETGLFVTGAYGMRNDDNLSQLYANPGQGFAGSIVPADDENYFWSVQAGIEKKWLPFGKTTLVGEYYENTTGFPVRGNGQVRSDGDLGPGIVTNAEISYWGIGLNQNFEAAALDLYIAYRHHQMDLTVSDEDGVPSGVKVEPEDLDVIMTGARIQF